MPSDPVVAVGLLTQGELDRYGSGLRKVYRVEDDATEFQALLQALDDAEKARGEG